MCISGRREGVGEKGDAPGVKFDSFPLPQPPPGPVSVGFLLPSLLVSLNYWNKLPQTCCLQQQNSPTSGGQRSKISMTGLTGRRPRSLGRLWGESVPTSLGSC